MAVWQSSNCIITNFGLQMLAQLQLGVGTGTITRAAVSTGRVSPSSLPSQSSMSGTVYDALIVSRRATSSGSAVIIQFSNTGLNVSFTINQVGIYATHPQVNGGAEFLYMLAQCDENTGDIVPHPEVSSATLNYNFYMVHSPEDSIEVTVDPAGSVSVSTLGVANGVATLGADGKLTSSQMPTITPATIGAVSTTGSSADTTVAFTASSSLVNLTSGEKLSVAFGKIAKAVSDFISHKSNTSNPHSVTKAQIGLENVPNVSTNGQTPTYTEASTLTNLTSGENLTTAFGKLKKAVSSLITHISNQSNPHSVTASQVGADPTGTASSAVSTHNSSSSAHSALFGAKANASDLTAHTNRTNNPHSVTASQVGLGNVPNVTTNNQTPTYAEASTLANITSGEVLSTAFGKIKKAISTLISHVGSTSNPHSVTKSQVGLGNVDNTSDTNKPVSTAQATAIADAKSAGTTAQSNLTSHTGNTSNPHSVTKAQVGLGNVPNVSTNNQTPTYSQASTLSNLVSGETLSVSFGKIMKLFADFISHNSNTSNPHSVTKSQVGLGNVDNTSDANKPVSTATQNALNGKANSSHSHSISNISGLQSILNEKAVFKRGAYNATDTEAFTINVGARPKVLFLYISYNVSESQGYCYMFTDGINGFTSLGLDSGSTREAEYTITDTGISFTVGGKSSLFGDNGANSSLWGKPYCWFAIC